MKMTTPITQASSCAPRPPVTHFLRSSAVTKPVTPPEALTVAMSAPMTRVNMMTIALPVSPSTSAVDSTVLMSPVPKCQSCRMVQPSQSPAARDR